MRSVSREVIIGLYMVIAFVVGAWLVHETMDQKRSHAQSAAHNSQFELSIGRILQHCREQVIQLPEDGGAFYLTVFVDSDWRARPHQRQLLAWFSAYPRLAALKAQTHWNVHTARGAMYRARWQKQVPVWPAVMLQTNTGKVIYKVSGTNVPTNGDQLADDITKSLWPFRPRPRPGPRPCPTPEPTPMPTPTPDTQPVIPDMTPDVAPTPIQSDFPWVLLIVLGVGTVLAIVAYHFHKPGGFK